MSGLSLILNPARALPVAAVRRNPPAGFGPPGVKPAEAKPGALGAAVEETGLQAVGSPQFAWCGSLF